MSIQCKARKKQGINQEIKDRSFKRTEHGLLEADVRQAVRANCYGKFNKQDKLRIRYTKSSAFERKILFKKVLYTFFAE